MDTTSVDFWFDPSCPYTWVTSRWIEEVRAVRPVEVRWHVLSLAVLNEGREDDPEGDPEGWLWQPVRVCAAVRQRYGSDGLGRFYAAYGIRAHDRDEEVDFAAALADAGLDAGLADTASSTDHDEAVRASHAEGIGQVGGDVGTPVLAAEQPDGTRVAFFGPVLSRVPRGDAAGRLWDGTLLVAGTPAFHELKGRPTAKPTATD
ncbi:disulfide bond formation protein DsbA [Plantactinospora siamensis]|uniref:Disulfide bond formation protein DsbA n=1 Tax=Plantactinospora siamensis TaxID=555372 RepID=A0ABV6P006_9ACTN